ncbi:MAG: formate dehydrogenase accessory sulfurtransferase FdhD [Pyrobaculum sp.]
MWISHRGVKVAVDRLVKIYVNDRLTAEVVTSPEGLQYLAWGYVQVYRLHGAEVAIEDSKIKIYIKDKFDVDKESFIDCGPVRQVVEKAAWRRKVRLEDLVALAREFNKLTMPFIEPELAVHTAALYSRGSWVVVHDVSRHSAVLKLIGKAAVEGVSVQDSVAFTTGRASGDMVTRLASVGVSTLVSMRGPLASGVEAACRYGVVLVANVRSRGFTPLCGVEYLE